MIIQHNPPNSAMINGIEIAYDSFGVPRRNPILLIAGLGNQMISWPQKFCEQLAAYGYWVIRFDNRDAGLSSRFDADSVPNLFILVWQYICGTAMSVPYRLEDMADDTVGLLAHLGLESAHVVGGSLGSMIAKMCAIKHAQRVKTLTVYMSAVYKPMLAPPHPKALILFQSSPPDRDEYIEHTVKVKWALRGGGFEFDEAKVREQARKLYERSPNVPGTDRQMAALLASLRHLRQALPKIQAPTLVIHGRKDPLVPVRHALYAAQTISKSRLEIIDGLGHELPEAVWIRVIEAIVRHIT